ARGSESKERVLSVDYLVGPRRGNRLECLRDRLGSHCTASTISPIAPARLSAAGAVRLCNGVGCVRTGRRIPVWPVSVGDWGSGALNILPAPTAGRLPQVRLRPSRKPRAKSGVRVGRVNDSEVSRFVFPSRQINHSDPFIIAIVRSRSSIFESPNSDVTA